jgi:NAD(P)-dependent dehydrogenase (short-subunit alcohol dehydrogenase family)
MQYSRQSDLHLLDVADEKRIETTLDKFSFENKRVDAPISNAATDPKVSEDSGITESRKLEKFEFDQWHLQVNVGLRGATLCANILVPL